jgi:hypothetical protein
MGLNDILLYQDEIGLKSNEASFKISDNGKMLLGSLGPYN